MRRRAGIAFAFGAVAVGLTGCWAGDHGGILTLTPDEIRIGACTSGEPVSVETLDTMDRPECLPLGTSLEFPDGTLLQTDEWAASGTQASSDSPTRYAWADVGIYGVVAAQYVEVCDDMVTWGRAEAVAKLRDAFGDGFGFC